MTRQALQEFLARELEHYHPEWTDDERDELLEATMLTVVPGCEDLFLAGYAETIAALEAAA